ncbi:MAG: hypothetical protein OEZ36_02435 [Spirochaetota bacterium]|nr:hypothetical protein [Spirochaetota bacterium]
MKIIAISHIQMNLDPIKLIRDEVTSADLVLLSGNLTLNGSWGEIHKLIEMLKILNPNILAVMGNQDSKEVLEYLSLKDLSLHGRGKVINNIGFYGLGGSNQTLFQRPLEYTEKSINGLLSKGIDGVGNSDYTILVASQGPQGTKLDTSLGGYHVGSRTLRSFIFKYPPRVLVSAPIFESASSDRLGPTVLASPEPFKLGGYVVIDTSLDHPVEIKNAYQNSMKYSG